VPRNELQQDATDFEISAQQRRAIEAILSGNTMTDAAKTAGVNRSTVWRWMNKDAEFQSALNSYKREALDQLSMRTTALASLAISAVEAALRAGDEKTGIAVLRGLGFLNGVRLDPPTDDVHELRMRQRRSAFARVMESVDLPDFT
jgi:hypothetical protein